jgi:hypothetical protein
MSPLSKPKARKSASAWERLCDTFFGGRSRRQESRRPRRLLIDQLEERQLLSVSAVDIQDKLVNQIISNSQSTITAKSMAMDDDGDFVVVWSRIDSVLDENGDPVINPATNQAMTDENIYARYFTNEVQRFVLPSEVLITGAAGKYATISISGGGNEVQQLVFSVTTPSNGNPAGLIQGSFQLSFNGNTTATIDFNEANFNSGKETTDPAMLIQKALRDLGGSLADVTVKGIDPHTFNIYFGDASGGANQEQIVVQNANFTSGFLPTALCGTISEPWKVTGIKISASNPALTALAIEDAFNQLYQDYMSAPSTANQIPANNGPVFIRAATPQVKVTSVKTADDPNGLRTFNIEFVGDSSYINHPLMFIEAGAVKDVNGVAVNAEKILAKTLKESSDEFRVNPEEPDNPFTALPDKFQQTRPDVAMDADGSFVIVWQSEVPDGENPGSKYDIFGRRYEPVGYVDQGDPYLGLSIMRTDMNRDGVIDENDPQVQGVRVQVSPIPYSATLTDPYSIPGDLYTFRVNELTTNPQANPSVGMDALGNFVVAWQGSAQPISYFNSIYARRFNADGTPATAIETRVNAEDTDVHTGAFVAMSREGHALILWNHGQNIEMRLYDANGGTMLGQQLVQAQAGGPTAYFDMDNNFVVGWYMQADPDAGGIVSVGFYAREYALSGAIIRQDFRINSASIDPTVQTTWSQLQYNGQVIMDADGDLTGVYQQFGPDTSTSARSGRATAIMRALINRPENADLVAAWPALANLTLPLDGMHSGDTDGVIEEVLFNAQKLHGFTDEQLGRLRGIMETVLDLLRGEANGIMFSQFDADPNLGPLNVISSDNVVNNMRDGENHRTILVLDQRITEGTFFLGIMNLGDGSFDILEIEPVYIDGDPPILDPDGTTDAIQAALDNSPVFSGNAIVRRISNAELNLRRDTYWELDYNTQSPQYVWEITFLNNCHDTPMLVMYLGGDLMIDDVPAPAPITQDFTTGRPGTLQHDPSIGMTLDGSFVVVWTQNDLNSAGNQMSQNIYYRAYKESEDTAGPQVSRVYTGDGTNIDQYSSIYAPDGLQHIVISMGEKMLTTGADSVFNPSNYVLSLNGVPITGAITKVEYGLNRASELARMAIDSPSSIYGEYTDLNLLPTNRYEIILTIDGNGVAAGTPALGTGSYTLTLLTPQVPTDVDPVGHSGLRDAVGNVLNRTGFQPQGSDFSINFSVLSNAGQPITGTEILVNQSTGYKQTTGVAYGTGTAQEYTQRSVAVDHSGNFVVVWVSYGQDGDPNTDPNAAVNAGVYMRLFDRNNVPLTNEIQVNTYTIGNQLDAQVAMDADGDFVVVWASQGQDQDGSWGIYGQRFDSMGRKLGGEFRVNSDTVNDQVAPAIAMDSAGNFVVVWASKGQAYSYFNNIKGQIFDADGNRVGSEFRVNAYDIPGVNASPSSNTLHPSVAMSEVGTFVVTWDAVTNQKNGVATNTIIMARLFDSRGNPIAIPQDQGNDSSNLEFKVNVGDEDFSSDYEHLADHHLTDGNPDNSKTQTARNAQVAMSWDGTFIITWEAFQDNDQIDMPVDVVNSWGIYYRRFNPNGTPDMPSDSQANLTITALAPPPDPFYSLQQSAPFAGAQVNSSISMDANGNYVIVWDGNGATPDPLSPQVIALMRDRDPQGIWTRTFHAQDLEQVHEAVTVESRVNLTQVGYQRFPTVAAMPNGSYVVVWSGKGAGDNEGVFARRYIEPTDTVGPMVTGFLLPDGTKASASSPVTQPLYAIVLTFDEALLASTATNINNYQLLRNGVAVSGGIVQAFYGLDKAYELTGQYGLNAQKTNKYQVVLIVDANGAAAGTLPLTDGQYQVVVKNTIKDAAGNPLMSFSQNPNGSVVSGVIQVLVPTGQETRVPASSTPTGATYGKYTTANTADAVAADADGDFVVVWTDTTPGHEGVWAKMYKQTSTPNADGSRTTTVTVVQVINPATGTYWANNEILISAGLNVSDVSVARDIDGDFVVTWSAWNAATDWDVFAQRFNSAGQAQGGVFMVNSYTTGAQQYSSVAMDADGDFVITWQSFEQDGSGWGVYAQRYLPNGTAIGGNDEIQAIEFVDGFTGSFRLRWDDDDNQFTPDKITSVITYSGNAFATAAAVQAALEGIGASVNVQAVSTTGLAIYFVGTLSGKDVQPLWIDPNDVVKTGGGIDAAVNVRTLGNGMSGEFRVNTTTEGDQMFPDIAISDAGNFIVTWTSYGQDGDLPGDGNIYARTFVNNDVYWTVQSASQLSASAVAGFLAQQRTSEKLTSVDNPDNHIVQPGTGYDGVVKIFLDDALGGGSGTGTLLAGTNYILTAAHVVWWDAFNVPVPTQGVNIVFYTVNGEVERAAARIIVNPGYTGDVTQGNDIALIELAEAPPAGVTGFGIYRGSNELGSVVQLYGYGMTGTGTTGETTANDDQKRTGSYKWEATGSLLGYADTTLVSDFDDGTPQHDALGLLFGIHDLGEGINEVSSAHGDSGGPLFLNGLIAGIVSFGDSFPGPHDVLPGLNCSFGDLSIDTRVSAFADWIDSITGMSGPEFLVNSDDLLYTDADGNEIWIDNELGNQSRSSVAMDAAGNYVITWTSFGHDGVGDGSGAGVNGLNGVYAKRYNVTGYFQSGSFQVNQQAAENQQNARVAMDADGDFVITWESYQDGSSAPDIYMRRYARTSLVQYAPQPPLMVGHNDLYTTDVMSVLLWTYDAVNGTGQDGLVGTIAVNNGAIGGEIRVNSTLAGDQRFPSVAMDDTGDAIVLWSGLGTVPGQQDYQGVFYQIFARPNDDAGPTVGGVYNVRDTGGGYALDRVVTSNIIAVEPTKFVITFGEDISIRNGSSGADSILNLANWSLVRNGQGDPVKIYSVQYGLDKAYELGLTTTRSYKYEAVVTFDGDITTAGAQALGRGVYTLTIKDTVKDLFGNKLDGDYSGSTGGNFTQTFTVISGLPIPGDDETPGNITPPGTPGQNDTDLIVNTNTTGTQDSPAVAADLEGNYVVVWVSYAPDGNADIKGQLYNRFGQTVGLEFTVNTYTTGNQVDPDVAMDSFGNFVVVWYGPGASDGAGVYAHVFDKYGRTVANDFRVNVTTQNIQNLPAVAMDAAGNFIVTWNSYGQDGDKDGVYARRFNLQGEATSGEFLVNTTTVYRQSNSDVAMNAAGDFIVVWQGDQQDGYGWGIFGQRYNAAGIKQGGEFRVNTTVKDDQTDPHVAIDNAGNFVVVWQSFNQDGSGYGIYAQRYNFAGTKLGTEFRVNDTTLNYQWEPDVGMDGAGNFTVTWSSLQDLSDPDTKVLSYGVYARTYDANGVSLSPGEYRVNATLPGAQYDPAIGVSPSGNFTIAWVGPDANLTGIYARLISNGSTSLTSLTGPTIFSSLVAQASGPKSSVLQTSEPLALTFNVFDSNGIASTKVTLDGKTVQLSGASAVGDGSLSYTAAFGKLTSGTHNYVITATDRLGNVSQKSGTFTVKASNVAPVISNVYVGEAASGSNQNGVIENTDRVVITWYVAASNPITARSVKIDGQAVYNTGGPGGDGNGSYWCVLEPMKAGTHTYSITMTDSKGLLKTVTGSFTVINPAVASQGPTISAVYIGEAASGSNQNGILENTDRLLITWNVSGTYPITARSVKIDGKAVYNIGLPGGDGNGNYWCALDPLKAGTHTYSITVTDSKGKAKTVSGSFTVKAVASTGPVISAVVVGEAQSGSNKNGVIENTDRVLITWNVSGAYPITARSVKIDGKAVYNIGLPGGDGNGNYWCSIDPQKTGSHTYSISMTDSKGKVTTVNGTFTVSAPVAAASAPEISLVFVSEAQSGSNLNGDIEDTDRVLITWNVSGANPIAARSVKIDGQAVNNIGGPGGDGNGNYWCSFGPLAAGTHAYEISVTDNKGGVKTVGGSFDVIAASSGSFAMAAAGGPAFSGVLVAEASAPRDGVLTTSEYLAVYWNLLDADGIAGTTLKIDGQAISLIYASAATNGGTDYIGSIGALAAGSHSYALTATDKLGNVSQYNGSFNVVQAGSGSASARKAVFSNIGQSLESASASAALQWLYDFDEVEAEASKTNSVLGEALALV